jgi:hypothetical protein
MDVPTIDQEHLYYLAQHILAVWKLLIVIPGIWQKCRRMHNWIFKAWAECF